MDYQDYKIMSEAQILKAIRENELAILQANRVANDLARKNALLRGEINKRSRKSLMTGFPVGRMVTIISN